MNNILLEKVKDFVAEFCGEPRSNLFPETSINNDLGIDGDDGVEFMCVFSERFAVDLTSFPHNRYFGPEAGANLLSISEGLIRCLLTNRWSALVPLRLCDLVEAAELNSWPVES